MINIFKKEIYSFFNSLVGYLAIAIFLLASGLLAWIFPSTSIIDGGYASLHSFFAVAPYLFLFLIPAIGARSIAGEKEAGTFDLLFSRPNTLFQIVAGKYLGIVGIAVLSILPTTIYACTIYLLASPTGNIDIGATLGSYLGLFFLACTYAAIAIFCSSLAKNAIVAFLLAVFALFFAYYGLEAMGDLLSFEAGTAFIKKLGLQAHYTSISRGVLDLADLIYFFSVSALFIIFTVGHLGRHFRKRSKTLTWYTATLLAYFLLNQQYFSYSIRLDLTEDRRFSISEATKEVLQGMEAPVHITIFLDGDLPNGFNELKRAAMDMASDLKSYAPGKLDYTLIDPLEGSQAEQQAFADALLSRGIQPTNLRVKTDQGWSQKLIFPTAVIRSGTQEILVNLLQQKQSVSPEEAINNSIQNLAYAFTAALKKANSQEPPFVGFTEGHGEPSDLELYDAMQCLAADGHQVGRVNLDSVTYASLDQLKLLFIVKPTSAFKESHKYKIDYFVRHGGRVVWAIDQVDASLHHLQKTGSQPLIARSLNLDDQLFMYGVRLNDELIADLQCGQIPITVGAMSGQPQIALAPWYFFPIVTPTSSHPIVRNLDGIRTEFVGTLDTVGSPSIKKNIILTSSAFAKRWRVPASISLQMVEEEPDPKKFHTHPYPVAVLLSGEFPYLFENRAAPSDIAEPIDLTNIHHTSKMLVFADADWLINQIDSKDQSPYPLGWDRYMERQFANKAFLQNTVDYLLHDDSLIGLRNRSVKLRLLNPVKIKEQKLMWQLVNVAAPILLLSVIALAQQQFRRRKFGKARR
ncbi:gliding motility-associated ABC transporter substrate-binding protein GldG [Sphingobacterium griseoflavum]|uniref:ABC-type uncharacterized transport system domain-containing protein n=1 Tax=Sphingobacterium griseoflavum TaxID=1474952 RepID=A0ABQ3HS66_9SPHI|nr:gliding motility-associated ABC transporter substrate-binding protein GldG [Sphingobacterium griseoflavum]GHE23045.1 hypothetical protein GCM10017764_00130 [Sphingobacterium griseoflavum]